MSVLVDTPIWIRFLSNRLAPADELEALLGRGDVVAHELVHGELLMGDQGGRAAFLEDYARIRRALTVPHDEVVFFARERRLYGRGIGWIDVQLLASAVLGRLAVWTEDRRLLLVAAELGVAYRAPDNSGSRVSNGGGARYPPG